jgi:hypothetical protein
MGFTHGTLPARLTFLGPAPFTEQQLIRYAYNYEQATRHHQPPVLFPPLAGSPARSSKVGSSLDRVYGFA